MGSIGFIAVVALLGVIFDHLAVVHLPGSCCRCSLALGASRGNRYGRVMRPPPRSGSDDQSARRAAPARVVNLPAHGPAGADLLPGPLYTFFSLYLQRHGYRASSLGLYWALGVAVEIVVFFFAARLLSRWDARTVLLAALANGPALDGDGAAAGAALGHRPGPAHAR